ncbi:MAG TPA: hypothetical protein VM370_04725 [Candidatus Thermoplasmatota archaeon]|nr:hypothetical protein [Candidatus Thermoplasmatota archaeon]
MARRLWLLVLAAGALLPAVGLVAADHDDCPPFERMRYDYTVEFHHGGDLFSEVHMVGFQDFRFCYEIRERVLREDIRWESHGGAYEMRIVGDGFEDKMLLHEGANVTRWYVHHDIAYIQVAGLAGDARPTLITGERPPAASSPRELLSLR